MGPLLRCIHRMGGVNGPEQMEQMTSKRWQLMLAVVCAHVLWYKKGCVTLSGGDSLKKSGKWTVCYKEHNPLSHHPAEAPARQRPRLCCLRDLFSHIGIQRCCSMRAWVGALEMPLFITLQQRSHYQRGLSMKVARIIDIFCSGITESSSSCNVHLAANRISWEV